MTVTVRLFAGASEAAGAEVATVDAASVADLRATLASDFGDEFVRVLRQCSVMVDGRRADDHAPLTPGSTVDILPPFAGG
ncbi:MoaD/ThiS family protein [Demequina globuliformis]|uniref:MoaD/ThiS family protein n=1 Tax=Demequina globuliformis TaxID=676202 RepID=UPI000781A8C2|nr:MoaD/ThiS family protein [Demequina globuliformis]